jgi:hypothetical protein
MTLVFAIAGIVVVWATLFVLVAGLGRAVLRLGLGPDEGAADALTNCWAGLASLMVFLQTWSLVFPIDGRAVLLLSMAGCAGWLIPSSACAVSGRIPRFLLAPVLWIADRALGPPIAYDSANYHMTLVRWARNYAVVPGLANLDPLFGLNPASLLFAALLENGPGNGRSSHLANGFLVALLVLHVGSTAAGVLRQESRLETWQAAGLLLAYPAVLMIYAPGALSVSTLSTDVSVAVFVFGGILLSLEGSRLIPASPSRAPACTAAMLLCVAPCIKLTVAVFACVAFGTILLGRSFRDGSRSRGASRAVVFCLVFAVLAAGSWMSRSAMLSGYPLFPLAFAELDRDWRMPAEYADGHRWATRVYGRTTEADELTGEGFDWLPRWLSVECRIAPHELLVPALLVLTLGFLLACSRRVSSNLPPPPLLLAAAAALVVWFLTAPLFRYGFPILWAFWSLLGGYLATQIDLRTTTPRFRQSLTAVCVSLPIVLTAYWWLKQRTIGPDATPLWRHYFMPAGVDRGFWPPLRPVLEPIPTCGGLVVYVPAEKLAPLGSPASPLDTRPWDGPLPCTGRLLLERICPRSAGSLAQGFRIDTGSLSWAERNAAAVEDIATRSGWNIKRLAMNLTVRPELVVEALAVARKRATRAPGLQ